MRKHVHVSMLMQIEVSEKQYDDLMQNGAPEVWMSKHLANKLRGTWHLDGCQLEECEDASCNRSN